MVTSQGHDWARVGTVVTSICGARIMSVRALLPMKGSIREHGDSQELSLALQV